MHLAARSDPQHRAVLPFDGVEPADVEHDAALDRHALAVIAGTAAADRDRHAIARRHAGDPYHVRLVARHHREVRDLVLQLPLENWAEPEKIARFLAQNLG